MANQDDTKLPRGAVGPGTDLVGPLQTVLRQINVLPDEKASASGASGLLSTPDSVAVIESGATALSKWWTALVGALGGTAVIVGAVQRFWSNQTGGTRIALIASFAGFLAAAVLAIAIIVSADVRGRATGSVAEYNARSDVTVAFLGAVEKLTTSDNLAHGAAAMALSADGSGGGSGPDVGALKRQAIVALAGAGIPADVRQLSTGLKGKLNGVRAVNGSLEVHFVPTKAAAAAQADWCTPDDIELTMA